MSNKNEPDSLNESGTVIKLLDNRVVVELNSLQLDHNGKNVCDSCGAKIVCMPTGNGKRVVNAYNNLNVKVGNKVVIKEDEQTIFKISLFQYGIPLLGFLAGIFLFYTIDLDWGGVPAEIIMFLGGICGLGISGMIAKYLISRLIGAKKVNTIFSIAKIIH